MEYVQQQAHKNLRGAVRCYWKLDNNSKDVQSYTIFPDGFFDLLICYHKDTLQEVLLSGLFNHKTNVRIAPDTTIYGVQFRLLAMETILQEPISSLRNSLKPLDTSFLELDQFNTNSDSSLFDYLDAQLLLKTETHNPSDPRKPLLLTLINQTKGKETVTYYSQQVNWSARQINRYFQARFGMSLKSYCSIRKGAATYSQIKNGALYPEQGYFDQPHFIKEIKKLTGFTPKTLSKNKNDRFLQFSIIKTV